MVLEGREAHALLHVVRRRGHLRGHGGACGGRLVALATTLTPRPSQDDTLTNAYKVALCVRAQGINVAYAKMVHGAAGAGGGFERVLGVLAATSTRQVTARQHKTYIFSTTIPT